MALDKGFQDAVCFLKGFLQSLKEEFSKYDACLGDDEKIRVLEARTTDIFPILDKSFDELWLFFSLTGEEVNERKDYFESMLFPFLGEGIETNTYIREKPLGYAGDFVMMNYIYDYHQKHYLGKSLYAKLINRYTCNIDVARSNIARKDYIKTKIIATLAGNANASILSVGCGSARELIELLEEGKIWNTTIHLLDLEKQAVAHIKERLLLIDCDAVKVNVRFYVMDLIDVIKDEELIRLFSDVDLVYASGAFDYLSDRVAKRVFSRLFRLTRKELLVFNMSQEHARHRVYYEVFGNWSMYHRCKHELVAWGESLGAGVDFSVKAPDGCKSYWIMEACKA
jgi:SAM-dependent methyltransferase